MLTPQPWVRLGWGHCMRLVSLAKRPFGIGLVVLLGAAALAHAQTTEYVYDTRNKLAEVRKGESVLARFHWDADGRLRRKIGQLGVRDYVYDGRRLLAEYDENGHQVAKYNWDGDHVRSVDRAGEGIRYFHYDVLDSVVALTDDSGNVVARYRWDAWGNLRNQDALNASQNRIGYTGHRFDEETGLHHAQTRYLDPTIGRFTTQDTYLGEPDDPASQNRFAYAQGNPTKYVDPTGEFVFLVPILIGVIAAELDIIHQEITQGKDLLTLDPSQGVDAAKAAKTGAVAALATATGQVLAGGALAGTGALGIGGTAAGATGTSTGSALIAGTVGGAGAAWTAGTLAGLAEGKSVDAAADQGNIAALPGTIGGAAGVLAGAGAQGLASTAGVGPTATRAMTAFAGGFAGDQAAQQTMIAAELQERTNFAQSLASGAVAYVVTEGTRSTPRLEPALRQPSGGATGSGSTVVGKVKDLQSLGPGENSLLKHLQPNLGTPQANWTRNSGVLRREMAKGLPLRDASVDPKTGALIDYPGSFLNAERHLLRSRGWTYDPATTLWSPPR
jgi:RHS repeat-associated protein